MGGSVAVTLRKPDASEFRMTRWTNSMPWGICNDKMFNADEEHMDEYLEQWLGMKDDWDKNHKSGNFEFPMTDCYFPGAGLVPDGYGLVVVDHVNKVILDMQGYTSFDNINVAGIGLDIDNTDVDSKYSIFKEFMAAGKVKGVTTAESHKEGREYDELDTQDLDVWRDRIKNNFGSFGGAGIYQFIIDTAPFTIERFEECNSLETARMHLRVKELGFVLTDEENKFWAETIVEQKEEEEWDEG